MSRLCGMLRHWFNVMKPLQSFRNVCTSGSLLSSSRDRSIEACCDVDEDTDDECVQKRPKTIAVSQPEKLSSITGVPPEHIFGRSVRVYELNKHAMQSGTNNAQGWEIEFDTRARWENPLMGWASSGDPLGNMKLQFPTETEAIAYCQKHELRWFIAGRSNKEMKKALRPPIYSENYSWNKRSRTTTK